MFSHAYTETIVSGILLLFIVFALNMTNAANVSVVDLALPPTCYSCEGISCLRISKLNSTTECTDSFDYCVTVFKGFTVIARGCYAELAPSFREKCDLDVHPECTKCVGNRCNDKGRDDFKCIQCESSNDSKCAINSSNSSGMKGMQCPIPTASNSYCYVRTNTDGSTTRGCLIHQREQRECLSDPQCSLCVSDFAEACNTYKVTGRSASGVSGVVGNDINTVITLGFMLVVLLLYNQFSN